MGRSSDVAARTHFEQKNCEDLGSGGERLSTAHCSCESFRRSGGLGTLTADGKNACGGTTASLGEADALDGHPV